MTRFPSNTDLDTGRGSGWPEEAAASASGAWAEPSLVLRIIDSPMGEHRMQLLGGGARWSDAQTPGVVAMGPEGWGVKRIDPDGQLEVNGKPVVAHTALYRGDRLRIGTRVVEVLRSENGAGVAANGVAVDETTALHVRFSRWSDFAGPATFELRIRGAGDWLSGDGTCEIKLPASALSRKDPRLVCRDGEWWLEDLGSLDGLAGEDAGAHRVQLSVGADVRVGQLTVKLGQLKMRLMEISEGSGAGAESADAIEADDRTAGVGRPGPEAGVGTPEPRTKPAADGRPGGSGGSAARPAGKPAAGDRPVGPANDSNTRILQAFATGEKAAGARKKRKGLFGFGR